jgi:dihydroflavonol-4-reductase
MKVMVTGGTGFVGSHTVVELVRAGHQVRLLVRDTGRVHSALDPLQVKVTEIVVGDVTDRRSIEEACHGCDATVHCGSVYSLDPRASKKITETNVMGTEIVLGTAHDSGHDPIIHVSSFVALIGAKGTTISAGSVPAYPPGAYFRSKAESDRVARKYQSLGAPIVITYPGSVWGPADPHLGESCQMARNILRRLWTVTPKGTVPITDVRDLARMHAATMKKGLGPRRYLAPLTTVTVKEAMSILAAITNRSLPTISLPAWTLLGPMQVLDWFQKFVTFRLPVNYQSVYCVGLQHQFDDSNTRSELGIEPRPLEETVTDTVRWMVQKGYLPSRLVGKLATTTPGV